MPEQPRSERRTQNRVVSLFTDKARLEYHRYGCLRGWNSIGVLIVKVAELAGLEKRREKTHAFQQAMIQELLNGKFRLV